ncbi:MAG TPA: ABC transporter [Rhodospirillaceae bacterium]|nr:ABC transporter [Rhodospirillaceae bacterium]
MNNFVLELDNICRSFTQAGNKLDILRGCILQIKAGERVALIGPSGAGKSTLLQIAGLLEAPSKGDVYIDGQKAAALAESERTHLRSQKIGFVYQLHHLLPEFSARENIILPQMIAGASLKQAGIRADELLELVALSPRAQHRPAELSGGEQQRIAIARALANHPALLIADEPTGNLDPHTANHVFSLLQDLALHQNLGLLMATHNRDLAQRMDRIVEIDEGQLLQL